MKCPKSLRYSPEPMLLFYVFGLLLHMPVLQQYVYMRISRSKGFPYQFSGDKSGCEKEIHNATLKELQKEVQGLAAGFQIGIGLFNTIPSIFVCLFYGALSDRIGRKTIFILSILGSLLEAIIVLLTMYFDWKVWIIFIGSFCNGIGGYLTGILMAVMAYIADTTAADRRAVRLGIVEGIVFIGATGSYYGSGYFISLIGFKNSYWIILGCLATALLYGIFILPESLPKAKRMKEEGSICMYPKRVWKTLTLARSQKWKLKFIIPAEAFVNMLTMGIGPTMLLYLLNNPFCWTSIRVGYFMGTRFLLVGLGAAFGLKVLGKCLSEHNMLFFGFSSHIAFFCVLGLAKKEWLLYLGCVIGLFNGIAGPILRGIISRIFYADEQGTIFAAVSSLEMLFTFIGNFIFNAVYPVLNKANAPGMVFILNVMILLVPISLILAYSIKLRRLGPYPFDDLSAPAPADVDENQNAKLLGEPKEYGSNGVTKDVI